MQAVRHTEWQPYCQGGARWRLGRYERRWFRWRLVWMMESVGCIAGSLGYFVVEFDTKEQACARIKEENECYRRAAQLAYERSLPWKREAC